MARDLLHAKEDQERDAVIDEMRKENAYLKEHSVPKRVLVATQEQLKQAEALGALTLTPTPTPYPPRTLTLTPIPTQAQAQAQAQTLSKQTKEKQLKAQAEAKELARVLAGGESKVTFPRGLEWAAEELSSVPYLDPGWLGLRVGEVVRSVVEDMLHLRRELQESRVREAEASALLGEQAAAALLGMPGTAAKASDAGAPPSFLEPMGAEAAAEAAAAAGAGQPSAAELEAAGRLAMESKVAEAGKQLEEQRRQGRQLQAALDVLRAEHKGFDARFAAAQASVRREEDSAAKQRVRSAEAEQAHRSAQLQMRAREDELLARAHTERFALAEKRKELRAAEARLVEGGCGGGGGGATSPESAGPSASELAWARVAAESADKISTPADLLRRALTHREMRRELEMAISRAAASRSQLRAEREKLLRRSGALEAASEARGGVRAAAANDLKAAETEASARLALVAAPRADAEARLREVRVLLRRVVGSAAEAAAPRRSLAAPPPCHGVLQVSECDAASDAELPLVLQAALESHAANTARGHAWGGAARRHRPCRTVRPL